jgi:hypothetical protein
MRSELAKLANATTILSFLAIFVLGSLLLLQDLRNPRPPLDPASEFQHQKIMELENKTEWILQELILREKENTYLQNKINKLEVRLVKIGG